MTDTVRRGAPDLLAVFLWILAGLSALLGLIVALGILSEQVNQVGNVTLMPALKMAAWFMAGCIVAAALVTLAWIIRAMHDQLQVQRLALQGLDRLLSAAPAAPAPAASPAAASAAAASPAQDAEGARLLLAEIRELNTNLLLSEDQRQLKRRQVMERESGYLVRRIEEAMAVGDLAAADEDLGRLLRVAPDHPQAADLRARIAQAGRQAEVRDVETATRKAADLMAAGNFDLAEAIAVELAHRRPGSAAPASLLERVRRERNAFQAEQRAGMSQLVQREATARHWRLALDAARKLIEAYPGSQEAEACKAQLPTLVENAQIEEVRELRDRIKDLVTRRRFVEALQNAQDVIERFPKTHVAIELGPQMVKLAELAKAEAEAVKQA